ncbi:Hypothetical predicted protein [Mytilus galloprovincialis]|uniref:Uncharacterized protein n=1 Tax=Mytilus galloprovincialis TaxID=29158 RepID=A0A8B6C8B6_MYTGA|nr:Hypothetical predicted protein [Mytilus galloprovincialis]
MSLNSELYDFSNYPADHPLYTKDRKSIIGLFKDECKSIQMVEYIGLRAKMYSFITADDKETVVAKGIKTRNVRFEQYKKHLVQLFSTTLAYVHFEKFQPSDSHGEGCEKWTITI